MTERGVNPIADNPNKGVGKPSKKWSWMWSYLYNGLTLAANAVGFSISGGTTSKTLTVEDTSLVDQDLTTDASPTFNQVNATTAHATTTLTDHLGEHTGGHGTLYDTAIADNVATTQIATTAFAKSQDAVLARLPDQAVNMTAGGSGTTGSVISNSAHINFPSNFTLCYRDSLPSWTENTYLIDKNIGSTPGYSLYNYGSVSKFQVVLNSVGYSSPTLAVALTANSIHEIVCVVSQTTSLAYFYLDGVSMGAGVAITPGDTTNTLPFYFQGRADARTAGTCSFAATYNRALSAAEVLDLYRNGIAFADKWGSQTSLVTGNDSTFSGANSWTNIDCATFDSTTGGVLTATASAQYQSCYLPNINMTALVIGKRYRIVFNVTTVTGTWQIYNQALDMTWGITGGITSANNGTVVSGEITAISTGGVRFRSISVGASSLVIDNVYVYEIGATLALEPEGIQNDKWYDSSSNALNATYPTTGWSLTRKLNMPRTNTEQPAFLACLSSTQSDVTGDATQYQLVCDTVLYNVGGYYNSSNGVFTTPVIGKYDFAVSVRMLQVAANHTTIQIELVTTARSYVRFDFNSILADRHKIFTFKNIPMSAADTAYIRVYAAGGSKVIDIYGGASDYNNTTFCGNLSF